MQQKSLDLVEVSFEVANKVGGIYQVLKSKNSKMEEFYGDKYLTIGFYDQDSAQGEFVPRENPYPEVFEELREEGIKCYYGVWNVEGQPKTILVDASELEKNIDTLKHQYWDQFNIDSINAGNDFDEPLKWGYAVSRLIQKLEQEDEFVVHLHEWLSAVPAFHIQSPTVFTAHATVLGRALSNSNYDLVSMVEKNSVNQDLAYEMGVKAKHDLEKAAAEESDVFTTVSKLTAEEASAVLEVKPDMVLPNGFNVDDYKGLEKLSINHVQKKKKAKEFLRAYFQPYYSTDLENDPRIFFTSGRYEYHNKGFNVLIEALAEVNEEDGKNVYFFFFVPSSTDRPNQQILENKSLYEELNNYASKKLPEVRENFVKAITSGENPARKIEKILSGSNKLERLQSSFHSRKDEKPPLSAFELSYEQDDILDKLREEGLTNSESDRVKVVFYPTYLSAGDNLLSMDYEEAVVASSAGFFPSYYEPWGYTPVETAANGALSVTTDLSGFGQFLQEETSSSDREGIKILNRRDNTKDKVVSDLADFIDEFANYTKTEITERKHNARKLVQKTSWSKLGENYKQAHDLAVENNDNY